jgi:hypothetical protein
VRIEQLLKGVVMKIGFLKFLKLSPILFMTGSFVHASSDEQFYASSNAFFDEAKVFQYESKRLMDNTHEVDRTLIDFERILSIPHKTSQALKTLDGTLTTIKTGLTAAEQIPQTKEQAQKLKQSLEGVQKPVSTASKKMETIDNKIAPLLKVVHNAELTASTLANDEETFRIAGIGYINTVGLVSKCEHGDTIISILDNSRSAYSDIDREMKRINDGYDYTKKIPQKAIDEISKEIDKISLLENPLSNLNARLWPIYEPLNELKNVLDKRISVKAPYICGVDTCYKEQEFPCGTKMCKKNCGITTCHYPCGVKMCSQKVPYPCGEKTCDIEISMSVSDAIKGSEAIEKKIESMLSSTVYKALKVAGLGSIIKDLENSANNLVKPVLNKLNFNIDASVPNLDINLDVKMIDGAIADIGKFDVEIGKLIPMVNMQGPTFKPYSMKLDKINMDIKSLLNSPQCHGVKH